MSKFNRILATGTALSVSAMSIGAAIPMQSQKIEAVASDRPPNIITIIIDDWGFADTTLYNEFCTSLTGSPATNFYETPNLHRLAARGVTFTNGYAGANLCSPSRGMIMSGRYGVRTGLTRLTSYDGNVMAEAGRTGANPTEMVAGGGADKNGNTYMVQPELAYFPLDEITIPELLKPQGYYSAHLGKWHLGSNANNTHKFGPLEQGFDLNRGGYFRGQPSGGYRNYSFPPEANLPSSATKEHLTDVLTSEALRVMDDCVKGKTYATAEYGRAAGTTIAPNTPFYINLAHYAPHTPVKNEGKEALTTKYSTKYDASPNTYTKHTNPDYAALIEGIDDSVGKVMDKLDALGIADNTAILFTSDNGGANYWKITDNGPLKGGKCSSYEGGIRIPSIMVVPKGRKGVVDDTMMHHIDFFPTIAELAGAKMPTDRVIDGISLVSLLRDGIKPTRDELFWYTPHINVDVEYGDNQNIRPAPNIPSSIERVEPAAVIRKGNYKLIHHFAAANYAAKQEFEIFDLTTDIGETKNLLLDTAFMANATNVTLVDTMKIKLNSFLLLNEARLPIKNERATTAGLALDKTNFTATANSEYSSNPAARAIDGNTTTIWHSNYNGSGAPTLTLPNSITIDMKTDKKINAVDYTPRSDSSNGRITSYKLFTSIDGINFNLRASGTDWANNATVKHIVFDGVTARYVKLQAIAGQSGFASAAEIDIFGDIELEPINDIAVSTTQGFAPNMPKNITVTKKGSTETVNIPVTWEPILPSSYDTIGTFIVNGTLAGLDKKVKANVTVEIKVLEQNSLIDNIGSIKELGYTVANKDLTSLDEFTLAFTLTPNRINGAKQTIIDKSKYIGGDGFRVTLDKDGKINLHAVGAIAPYAKDTPYITLKSSTAVKVGEKNDIAICFSNKYKVAVIYLNGEIVAKKDVLEPIKGISEILTLGASDKTDGLYGELSNVCAYDSFVKNARAIPRGDVNFDTVVNIEDSLKALKIVTSTIDDYKGSVIGKYDGTSNKLNKNDVNSLLTDIINK